MSVHPVSASRSLLRPSRSPRRSPLRSPLVIALFVVDLLVMSAVIERLVYDGDVLPGVSVSGHDIGAVAASELGQAVDPLRNKVEGRRLQATVGDVRVSATAGDVGVHIDEPALLRAARQSGRSGNPIEASLSVILRRVRANEVALPLRFDDAALDATAEEWTTAINAGVRDATVSISEDAEVTVMPGQSARGVTRADVRAALIAGFRDIDGPDGIALPTRTIRPRIDDATAELTAEQAREIFGRSYKVTTAPTTIQFSGKELALALRTETDDNELRLAIDTDELRKVIDGRLDSETTPPVDATFRPDGNGGITVVPSRDGRGPDLNHIAAEILAENTDIDAPMTTAHPTHDTAWAESLGIHELVATFTSHHPCCAARVTNIHTAARYLDGAVIEPGEVFSLNRLVGPRTAARGFVSAPVFYGEFTEDFGGGVSQLATTTYNAAFWGGFEIIEHKPHSIYFDRYPMGREATVNYPSLDLKWRNDSAHGVFVDTSFSSTGITVALYGDRDGKRVRETTEGCSVGPVVDTRDDPRCINVLETIDITESDIVCPVENPSDDPDAKCATLAPGERVPGAAGHTGYRVEYFRTITRPGKKPVVQRFTWRYRMLPNVFLVGDPEGVVESTTTSGAPGATTTTKGSKPTTTTSAPPTTTT